MTHSLNNSKARIWNLLRPPTSQSVKRAFLPKNKEDKLNYEIPPFKLLKIRLFPSGELGRSIRSGRSCGIQSSSVKYGIFSPR